MNSRRRRLICPSLCREPYGAEIARPKPVSPLPQEPAPDRAAAGGMAEVARLMRLTQDKIAEELAWDGDKPRPRCTMTT